MKNKINKLFEYFDSIFFEEKVEIDKNGIMGAHYDALNFDRYLENSVLGFDYLSIEDYFESTADVEYNEVNSLFYQYSDKSIEKKCIIIGSILTLINNSSYKIEGKDLIIKKSKSFLKRFGLEVEETEKTIRIINECKLFEGSYCNILMFNEQYYKKQLKNKYRTHEDSKKRLRYEYENMLKLVESPYVLNVFNYDELNDYYLMEKCDYNIDDYLKHNPFINDDELLQLIKEIILGMNEVHNAGIIHRDLHLGNILIKDGHVILSDFGLSKDTMINHSLKSTSTPKNSHYFLDPIGLSSFKLLDKLSDIYSIGKIIDYITKDSNLNEKLSFIINKSTDRNRNKRYNNFSDMMVDLELSLNNISNEERIKNTEINIQKCIISPDVEEFIIGLMENGQLSSYIVKKQLFRFGDLLVKFKDSDQILLLNEINKSYSQATGYNHFENYDLFATIMYNVICNSSDLRVQSIASNILKGCAGYRFKAQEYLDNINIYYPRLRNH